MYNETSCENKIVKESAVQLKLPIGKVTNNTYLDAADVINNIELLNTTKNPFDPEIKKKWSNAITSGKFLQNMYGAKIPANLQVDQVHVDVTTN